MRLTMVFRREENSVITDGSGTSELHGTISSFDRDEQHEKGQFHRTRAFSHGDLSNPEFRTERQRSVKLSKSFLRGLCN